MLINTAGGEQRDQSLNLLMPVSIQGLSAFCGQREKAPAPDTRNYSLKLSSQLHQGYVDRRSEGHSQLPQLGFPVKHKDRKGTHEQADKLAVLKVDGPVWQLFNDSADFNKVIQFHSLDYCRGVFSGTRFRMKQDDMALVQGTGSEPQCPDQL